jgi:hypothetical protein
MGHGEPPTLATTVSAIDCSAASTHTAPRTLSHTVAPRRQATSGDARSTASARHRTHVDIRECRRWAPSLPHTARCCRRRRCMRVRRPTRRRSRRDTRASSAACRTRRPRRCGSRPPAACCCLRGSCRCTQQQQHQQQPRPYHHGAHRDDLSSHHRKHITPQHGCARTVTVSDDGSPWIPNTIAVRVVL